MEGNSYYVMGDISSDYGAVLICRRGTLCGNARSDSGQRVDQAPSHPIESWSLRAVVYT